MSDAPAGLQLELAAAPCAARVLDESLAGYAGARRAAQDERMRAEGRADAARGAVRSLEQAAEALAECRQALYDSVAETAAALAVEMTQELLRKELSQGHYDLVAIVREALAAAGSSSGGTILRLNPADVEALADIPFRTGTELQADPAIRRGDVQVRTDQGLLVREIDACLATIRVGLQEALRSC